MGEILLTAETVEHALRATMGNVSAAADRLGVTRTGLYAAIERHGLTEVLHESRQRIVDLAETKLYEEIEAGNPSLIVFALKTLGKSRGYQDNIKVDGDQKIVVDLRGVDPEVLKEIASADLDPSGEGGTGEVEP
jgi:hypothetical protein